MGPEPARHSLFFFVRMVIYGVLLVAFAFASYRYLLPLLIERQLDTVTIVYSGPLALESTTVSLNSVKLALEEYNYRAGDIKLILTELDGGDKTGAWTEERERENAEWAVAQETAMVYLGPVNSGAAKVSMPILNRAGILQVSPSNTWPGLTKIGFLPGEPGIFYPTGVRHYTRVAPTDDLQGPAGALWARELGFTTVYVVNDSDSYGIGIANLFEAEAARIGLVVVGSGAVTAEKDRYTKVAADIVASNASLVYYGGTTPNGGPELLRELRALGSSVAFMGPDGIFEPDFINRAGASNAEGVYVTAIGAPPEEIRTEAASSFLTAYRSRFNSEPDVFGALAYDATVAIIKSIERAGVVDRKAILREMRSIKSHPGIFGVWGFDQNGDTTMRLMSGNRIERGTFTFVKLIESE